MKKYSIFTIFTVILTGITFSLSAQVGISTDNSPPDSSAMLDVKSTNKGLLIPRLTTTQRTGISNPAEGLLVYDITTKTFWYYKNTAWTDLGDGAKWSLSGNSGTNPATNFIGTTDNAALKLKVNNVQSGIIDPASRNVSLGYTSLIQNTTGNANTAVGDSALSNNDVGHDNVALGASALHSNSYGFNNTAIGTDALYHNITGIGNIGTGYGALYNNTIGNNNTTVGTNALSFNTTGYSNVAVGVNALSSNTTGHNNIALGDSAGYTYTTLSNIMYLGLRDTVTDAGIYFNRTSTKKWGRWNGTMLIQTIPTETGTPVSTLVTDATGLIKKVAYSASADSTKNPFMYSAGNTIQRGAGNVGIGTSTPDETLSVSGTLDFGNVLVQRGKKQTIYRQSANTDVARGNALAAAFSASIAGDNVIIGNGNYSISATLALKGSQTIILQGANITSTNNTISIFTATDVSNWQIKGSGLLKGAGSPFGDAYTDERGIAILKSSGVCSNWEITGLSFTNFKGCAIFSNGSSGSYPYDKGGSIHNNNIYGNSFGIYFDSPTNIYTPHYIAIIDNHFYNNYNYAVYLMGGNCLIDNNTITSNFSGIYLGAGYNHAHGTISNNEINHNTTYGIYFDAIIYGETVSNNHILVNQVNVFLNACKGVNITGGMIYAGTTYDVQLNGTFTGFNYIANVNSSNSSMSISATPVQRAKLIVHGCFSTSNQNPSWNDIIPVKPGVADSAIRPDYSKGGILSIQALPIVIDYKAISPIEIRDGEISLDTTKAMLFNDTLTAGKIETKYHSKTTFVPKSEILTLAAGGYDSTSISLTGFNKIPIEYSSGLVVDTLIFIGVGASCNVTFKVRYGNSIADTGTAVVIAGNAITSVSTATKISSFNNATIAKGNMIWIVPTAITTVPRRVIVLIKGHRI